MVSNIILDISKYGYPGKTITLKEPTGADIMALNDFITKEKKQKGDSANMLAGTLFLISRVIIDAPFDSKIETLKEQPMKLLLFLDKTLEEMMNPFPKEKPENLDEIT